MAKMKTKTKTKTKTKKRAKVPVHRGPRFQEHELRDRLSGMFVDNLDISVRSEGALERAFGNSGGKIPLEYVVSRVCDGFANFRAEVGPRVFREVESALHDLAATQKPASPEKQRELELAETRYTAAAHTREAATPGTRAHRLGSHRAGLVKALSATAAAYWAHVKHLEGVPLSQNTPEALRQVLVLGIANATAALFQWAGCTRPQATLLLDEAWDRVKVTVGGAPAQRGGRA